MKRFFTAGNIVKINRNYSAYSKGMIGMIVEYYNDRYRSGETYEKYVLLRLTGESLRLAQENDLNTEFYVEQEVLLPVIEIKRARNTFKIPNGNSETLWKELVG